MALHEKMKHAIIVEEIFGYLLQRGYTNINLAMNADQQITTFVLTIANADPSLKKDLEEHLYTSREQELEEYGWDLYCESDSTDILQTLGMLVDNYKIEEDNSTTILTLYRNKG